MSMEPGLTGSAAALAALPADAPYLGLRYFKEADAGLFFGRDEHTIELLGKLAENRFVAVLGTSGSGKSSLVRAGLLPELRAGMIPHAGPRWAVVEFQPGNGPLPALAEGVRTRLGVAEAGKLIEEGPFGLVNVIAAARLDPDINVLVIADQFEEVFRYQREQRDLGNGVEAAQQCQAVVRCLLEAATASGAAIYIMLVMRSDYLGECSQFPDLPERMSQSIYLVPRLRRDQVEESITAPVGYAIEPALVQELLGQAAGDSDPLPRLQHLLSRMWTLAGGSRMTMEHYKTAGRWGGALNQHLGDVFVRLGEPGRLACKRMFQRLSDADETGRVVRRRALLADLVEACGPEVAEAVAAFGKEGFLKPGDPVDITHECVLRNWPDKMTDWLREEGEAREYYREIKLRRGREALLTRGEIRSAQSNFSSGRWSAAWAKRYGSASDFADAQAFVTESAEAEQKSMRRELSLRRLLIATAIAFMLVTTVAAVWLSVLNRRLKLSYAQLQQASAHLSKVLSSVQEYAGSKNATQSSQQTAAKTETGLSVPDIVALYDFPTELNGQGQTIAVIELGGGYADADIESYFSQLNIPASRVSAVGVGGAGNKPGGDADGQVTADIEIAGAVAPAAQIVAYFAPNTSQGYADAINRAIRDTVHHPSIISIGWGGPEPSWTPASIQAVNQALQDASVRGITVVTSAGDSGVTDGLAGLRSVDFPASSPWALAVGGTALTVSNGQLVDEKVWNDGQNMGATGGGVSSLFPVPAWQTDVKIPAAANGRPGRGIPDVAANAAPSSGYQLYLHGASVTFGGTSMSAPLWAGLLARINQGLGRNVGYINPILYQKLGASGAFRNITQGNNSYGGVTGYTAGSGWNLTAGWGSPNGRKLLNALRELSPKAQTY